MKTKTNHLKIFIFGLIWIHVRCLYQLTPAYWHHFSIPRTDNLCSVTQSKSVYRNVTLLECTLFCYQYPGNSCLAYNYYPDLRICQLLDIYGIGFEIKSNNNCLYYQNGELPPAEIANLALNHIVYASGNCTTAGSGATSSLTDGLTSPGGCPCIKSSEHKWFAVDLNRNVKVQSVAVTTASLLSASANFFIVGLTNTFDQSLWTSADVGPYTFCAQFPQTVKSSSLYLVVCQNDLGDHRYVVLIQNVTTIPSFDVCEVEVYGKYVA